MGNPATSQATRSWRIKHPYLTDNLGRPEYYRGHAPSFHGLIYFVGASGAARVMLTITHPRATWIYVAVYAGCVVAALAIGALARAKEQKDENFGRKLSAIFGLLNFIPTSMMSTLSVHAAAQPAAAGIAPLAASAAILLGTLVAAKLPDWFPDPDPQPRRRKTSAP